MKKRYYFLIPLLIAAEVSLQLYFGSVGWGTANSGVSFGLLKNLPVSVLFVAIFLFWGFSASHQEIGWRLVLLGGAANLMARLVLGGAVWDYLSVAGLGLWFNGADLLITAGVMIAIVEQFRKENGQT